MDTLKQLITENDSWSAAEGENDGTPFILRFRPHLQDFIATHKYNKRFTILWQYSSYNDALMPTDQEMELMQNVENSLVGILEEDLQSVLAFVYTGQSQREWHWYSSDITETGKRFNQTLSDFDKLPIELSAEDDPEWSEYNAVLEGADDSECEETDDE